MTPSWEGRIRGDTRKEIEGISYVRKDGTVVLQKGITCPGCKAVLDAHSPIVGPAVPKEGDLGLCFYCGVVMEFWDGGMRILSPEGWAKVPPENQKQILAAQAIAERRRKRGLGPHDNHA